MPNLVGSITRAATRRPDEPLNILCFPTHERYETGLALTGHSFYALRGGRNVKDWNRTFAPVPPNYMLLNPARGETQIPADLDFDLVLSQSNAGQYPIARQLAAKLHLPLVVLEHTWPHPSWTPAYLRTLKQMRGDVNVFISERSREAWGWAENEALVVHHGVDTELFAPRAGVARKAHVLSVVNDFANRDWCCGWNLWQETTRGLPVHLVGDTPGWSTPAANPPELAGFYAASRVFLNTSLVSPVPTVLLEAMSAGCAVVSTATCMIPDFLEHGVNGLMSNDPAELRQYLEAVLNDEELARRLGDAARQTVLDRFSMAAFVANWNGVLRGAAEIVYTGASL